MSVADMLRGDAEALETEDKYLTDEIEKTERRIVDLRRRRDDGRFRRADLLATADFLDRNGWRVERDPAGMVTVHVDPPNTEPVR